MFRQFLGVILLSPRYKWLCWTSKLLWLSQVPILFKWYNCPPVADCLSPGSSKTSTGSLGGWGRCGCVCTSGLFCFALFSSFSHDFLSCHCLITKKYLLPSFKNYYLYWREALWTIYSLFTCKISLIKSPSGPALDKELLGNQGMLRVG